MRNLVATLALGCVAFGCVTVSCRADAVFVIDAHAFGARLPDSCNAILWDVDTVFYNLGTVDATVKLVRVSNGGIRPGVPNTIVLSGGRASSIREKIDRSWRPNFTESLWMYELDVPSNVEVDSEMFPLLTKALCTTPFFEGQAFGKTKLPVFHSLVPAGRPQVLTGLTLGDLPSHINVAIYNAGVAPASATVEMHRACDGAVIDTLTVTVPANTVQQFGGFSVKDAPLDCTLAFNGPNGLNRLAYAVVTVDQSSLAFASILADGQLPISAVQVSGVQLPATSLARGRAVRQSQDSPSVAAEGPP